MEVSGLCSEVFEGLGPDEMMSHGSTLSLTPLIPHSSASLRRSSPQSIPLRSRKETKATQAPSIPNPFPELCSPSNSPVLISSLVGKSAPSEKDCHVVRVYGEDTLGRSLSVSSGATARDVCQMLVQTAHCSDQESWALIELHASLGLERCLEDHERVVDVQSSWPVDGSTKLLFRKNYAKYEFFKKPMLFFPESMISDSSDCTKGVTSSELVQKLLQSGACPEIQGFLHVREGGRKVWKRVHYFLRRSGLYCSNKGSSKEPRHLQYVADLADLNIYTVTNSRKLYMAPTEHTFCVKSRGERARSQDMKLLCAEDEQSRTCWITAFRLFKYGKQLQCNYQLSQSSVRPQVPPRDAKARQAEDSMVAMDFTGKNGGRVIQNPKEAENAEQEEGQAWRKREALRNSLPNVPQSSRPSSVHQTQPWFHGGVSRCEAQRLIEEQGQVDGMFLIRESQQHAQCFVLSLCYKLKTKHYLLIPFEKAGRKYYTMDDGDTVFIDLLQLVEFHLINRGILPVRLKHPCVRVAL
ncbi:growth factor receptor-bound protein 7 [Alosa sapidissima]|uniref:growth factor receptor-bound protein 7 n=1 Tax=Alosa sapidissima TaxID=34773 RepID=UPI001C080B15|nr:growth factor receptor-bound protein 7 [Alosa sapidissima]XP_041938669.1 growth factor receptor-bound protein 7 [Alosa sapidissima]XP_041938670.1 growth factor receptor-bound protein 7 [Alosa sapidissima]